LFQSDRGRRPSFAYPLVFFGSIPEDGAKIRGEKKTQVRDYRRAEPALEIIKVLLKRLS